MSGRSEAVQQGVDDYVRRLSGAQFGQRLKHLLIEELSEPERQAVRIVLPALARAIEDHQAHT
ncbi:hypothetical protein [Streptomyces sp. PSKA30]|uniref:hypothetical protein n=1 Tax=Streptomyces sp. PSKA30 TaxID=2874597 RepID=UPI001CD16812|nr:hypothetical protein [Streptomyces sp. PSKA30]MBZ9641842.1 hypothetical protein [Streptomyces sp. PSKA30]